MTRLHEVQTNFVGGELDPKLHAQTDLKAYKGGLRKMRNLARLAGGGVERRPGTWDLAGLAGRARLVDFEFSSDQRYVVAFTSGRLDVFADSDGVKLITITSCPWNATTMLDMSYTQSGDSMVITHADFMYELKRTGAATFSLAKLAFDKAADNLKVYQPYYKFADDTVTMSVSATTGAVTVTASGVEDWGGFAAGHVGQRFRIYDVEVRIDSITSATVAQGYVLGELIGKLDIDPFKTRKGSSVVEVLHVYHGLSSGATLSFRGSNDVGAASDGTGGIPGSEFATARAITVLDEHRYTITVSSTAAASDDGGGPNVEFMAANVPTREWREPSISPVRGYPGSACFHEGRLWLGATPSQPDGYFGSDALKYNRFDVGKGYDGQSIQGAAGLESMSSIQHLISNGNLQVFTPTTEGIFAQREGEPLTPSAARVVRQSIAGSSKVMPQVFDNATIFSQENAISVSELVYDERNAGYVATPVSTIAAHLLSSGVKDIAVSAGNTSRAEQFAFFPVEDGSIAVFHSMRAENIAGWGRWDIADCIVHSMCSVGHNTYACVERRSSGLFRLYRFATTDTLLSLDGSVEHTANPGKTDWTLETRVRGRRLAVRSERGFHGIFDIPADGAFTVPFPCTRLIVGDPYYYELETLPPRVELPSGARDRLVKRIVRAIIEMEDTESGIINGQRILVRQVGDDPASPLVPYSGAYTFRQLGYAPSPTIRITQDEPTFARILGLTLEVKV